MTVLDLVPDLDTKEQRRRERELRRMEEASGPMEPEDSKFLPSVHWGVRTCQSRIEPSLSRGPAAQNG